ncbi:MAG: DUF1492 domain-containing protein [Saccharofermentans sp.]|jgi:hypothetical protein|nr:DUF1492 domain-containing protein [Mageeibacillus sp.]MCI1264612.1 DUF1492 domain-containing protein [Saccharofermentans sp.]MCI1275860.1 DUF1492 domain-containing protein [Saccharofermentans sp.]MCI2044223.1 DUF1492 domain-containing protein [Mageeibacillus sp.]
MDNLSNIEDRLKRLKKDLCITKADTSDFYTELMQVYQDKRDSIIDIYAKLYSPASTSLREEGYSSDPLCSGTMTQRMLAFSSGYDNFIEGIEERYRGEIMRKRQALDLFSKMLSLPYPSSKILYLAYYKLSSPDDIIHVMYISRSSYFRYKRTAINQLKELFEI